MSSNITVPFHRPSIGADEVEEVMQTLGSGWLTTGPRTAQFETEFRRYLGVPHAMATNSCTAALHLALAGLNIGPGAEVITTPLTFCATVNVILHVGATPVLADVGADGNLDPFSVRQRLTERTRVILPVHLAGLPCDMTSLWSISREHHLHVIEDCAHAAGARYRGWPIGAGCPDSNDYSDACAFSFYATKNMTTGEGGMVSTHDGELADSMRVLCLHGISKDAWNRYSDRGNWFYEVLAPGFKYNLSDIHAAIGIHQLRKLDSFIAARTRYAQLYNTLLADVDELETPPDRPDCQHAWHLYAIRLNLEKLSIARDEFIEELRAKGIATSVHFIPIPLHPFFAAFAQRPANRCPRAMAIYHRLISLPLYPAMTEEQVRYVAETTKGVARQSRKKILVAAASASTAR